VLVLKYTCTSAFDFSAFADAAVTVLRTSSVSLLAFWSSTSLILSSSDSTATDSPASASFERPVFIWLDSTSIAFFLLL
jgi:hypothetical protein